MKALEPIESTLPEHFRHAQEVFDRLARLPDRRPPWQWMEEHIRVDDTSPYPGFWKLANSYWVKQIMEDFADSAVKEMGILCSAQSAKTQTDLCMMTWAIGEDPAPLMVVTSDDEEAKIMANDRIKPTFERCQPVARMLAKGGASGKAIRIPGCPIVVTGSRSKSSLQSKPVRWLFLDEVRNYPPGAYEMVRKRTRAWWNSKTVTTSTADKINDAAHRAFLVGDQNVWNVPCMDCGEFSELDWQQMKWDKSLAEGTRPDFDALTKTIFWECPTCGHQHRDTGATRNHFVFKGKFIPRNPTAPKSKKSYHWNALLPQWIPWRELVEEFIIATDTARLGDIEPLKDFINESLGQPWEDRHGAIADDHALDHRKRGYRLGEKWPDGAYRIIAADKQAKGGKHYWWVVREFARYGGESRLIAYGRANTDEELIHAAEKHKVHRDRRILDCGYDWAEVLRFCHRNGWKPFRGDGAKSFLTRHPGEKQRRRQTWTTSAEPVNFGTAGRRDTIVVYRWSNPSFKDMQAELTQGLVGNWTLPEDTDEEYVRQYTAEIPVEKIMPRGEIKTEWTKRHRDDHLKDCELQITVAAVIMNILKSPLVDELEKQKPADPAAN